MPARFCLTVWPTCGPVPYKIVAHCTSRAHTSAKTRESIALTAEAETYGRVSTSPQAIGIAAPGIPSRRRVERATCVRRDRRTADVRLLRQEPSEGRAVRGRADRAKERAVAETFDVGNAALAPQVDEAAVLKRRIGAIHDDAWAHERPAAEREAEVRIGHTVGPARDCGASRIRFAPRVGRRRRRTTSCRDASVPLVAVFRAVVGDARWVRSVRARARRCHHPKTGAPRSVS